MSLAEELKEQIERHREACAKRGPMWAVHFDEPINGVYAEPRKGLPAVLACLAEMRRPWGEVRAVEGRDDLVYVPLDMLERFCVPESFMKGLMACLRASGLHGFYYECPEVDKEFITGKRKLERKEYRF